MNHDSPSPLNLRVGVVGAGAIGSTVACRLAESGATTVLLGRKRHAERASELAVELTPGEPTRPGGTLRVTHRPEDLHLVDICLVTVKSRDTEEVAKTLSRVLRPDTIVVSLQNGLRNPERLRERVAGPVVPGVVGFNVARLDDMHFRQTTQGPLKLGTLDGEAGQRLRRLRDRLEQGGQPVELRPDIEQVAAGKLLVNLNNGVCAATGLGIVDALRSRDARWCFAQCVREARRVLLAHDLPPAPMYGVPSGLMGWFLALPNVLVLPFAKRLTQMDREARSSTLQDLERGRLTEIDDLNGEILALARDAGVAAPANAVVVEHVRRLERRVSDGRSLDFVSADGLRREIRRRSSVPTATATPLEL